MRSTALLLVLLALVVAPALGQWDVSVPATRGGNSPGRACTFPFIYKGVSHNECITTDNKFIPWCATTSSYDSFNQWTNCQVSIVANRTRNGNAAKSFCIFPFYYKGRQYTRCTTDDHFSNRPWCATSANYDRDRQWAECVRYASIKTTGGNVPSGTECNFPFWYRGQKIQGCITTNNQGVGWCGTSSSYDRDKLWGNCVITTIDEPESGNCPNGNTYTRESNTLSYGAQGRSGVNTVGACRAECDRDGSCIGFDYDYNTGVPTNCYIHTNRANFNTKQRNNIINVDQYTLTNRCTTDPGTGGGGVNPGQPVSTRGGNAGRSNRCSFPFSYNGHSYISCTSTRWYVPWCAVTPNYGRDGLWGECSNIATS